MNISIVGTGYVGLVTGACLASLGNDVTCVDISEEKIESLKNGIIPIYEPQLDGFVKDNVANNRLHFSTRLQDSLNQSKVVFIAVGTPPDEDGSADLSHVLSVARNIGQHIENELVVVTKSTVPVGTSKLVKDTIIEEQKKYGKNVKFHIASNPEFLKEGSATNDFLNPDRIIIGTEDQYAKDVLTKLYQPLMLRNFRVIFTDTPSAEMIKYAANAMLATRISFMNDLSNLCERLNVNVSDVRLGLGSDTRIGNKFLYPGCGYGGSCFPKDVKALLKTSEENGYSLKVLKAVEEVNQKQKTLLFEKFKEYFAGEDLAGKKVAMWGLAFKPNTDDMREATSAVLIDLLLDAGCKVSAFDPVAMTTCKNKFGDKIEYAQDMYSACKDADALMVVTEWRNFRVPNWDRLKDLMKVPFVLDGRNIYFKDELLQKGFVYSGIGQKTISE